MESNKDVENVKVDKESGYKHKAVIALLVVLVIVLSGLLVYAMYSKNYSDKNLNTPVNQPTSSISISGVKDSEVTTAKKESKMVAFQGFSGSYTIVKGDTITLENRNTSDFYMGYTFKDSDTGKVLYCTVLNDGSRQGDFVNLIVPGGKPIYLSLGDLLSVGDHNIEVSEQGYTKDSNGNYSKVASEPVYNITVTITEK